jgi:hypothetical protein
MPTPAFQGVDKHFPHQLEQSNIVLRPPGFFSNRVEANKSHHHPAQKHGDIDK